MKTEGVARGFQPARGTLRMLMNDKIMFDRYYWGRPGLVDALFSLFDISRVWKGPF